MSFLRNMEPLKELTGSLFLHSIDKLFHSLTVEGKKGIVEQRCACMNCLSVIGIA